MKKITLFLSLYIFANWALAQTHAFHPQQMTIKLDRTFKELHLFSSPASKGFSLLRSSKQASSLQQALQNKGAISLRPVFQTPPSLEEKHKAYDLDLYYYVDFEKNINAKQLSQELKRLEGLVLAEPVDIYEIKEDKRPNDARFGEQWCFNNTRFPSVDINIFEAWRLTTGHPQVIVAIIDNCFDITHSDIKDNLWVNAAEIPNNGKDDDGNGYTDDIHGWNFYQNTAKVGYDKASESHGTHVGGIVAARTHNKKGVAGVAGGWNTEEGVKIMVFRAGYTDFTSGKSYVSHGYDCMIYAADNGAAIAQCSWGGSGIGDLGQTSIRYFTEQGGGNVMKGGLVIAAAGNDHSKEKHYPAAHESVLAVGSIQPSGALSDFSNYGDWVEISAPGTGILSTIPEQKYGELSGTSMACPIVSGVASLVLSASQHIEKEEKTPQWLKNVLIKTGKDMPYEEAMGPLIDAGKAVLEVADPHIVRNQSLVEGNTDCVVWPNPCQDHIFVQGAFAQNDPLVQVYAVDGRIVLKGKLLNGRLSLSSVPPGFYVIKLVANGDIRTLSLVKNL